MALIDTTDQLFDMVEHYLRQDAFTFDVETMGDHRDNPHIAPVVWISFATHDRSDVIPLAHPHGELVWEGPALLKSGERKVAAGRDRESLPMSDLSRNKVDRTWEPAPRQIDRGTAFGILKPLFRSDLTKVGHNVKFDLHAVRQYLGEYPEGPYYDTLIASWLTDVGLRKKGTLGLAQCVDKELGETLEKGVGKRIEDHAFSVVAKYSELDALYTWRLYQALEAKYRGLPPAFARILDLEMQVLHPILQMEMSGVRIDTDVLHDFDKELRQDIDGLQGALWGLAGRRFNVRSNRDKQEILFGEMGIHPIHPVPGAAEKDPADMTIYDWAVDHETLERNTKEPFVRLLMMYSAKAKLHGTYVLPYLGGETVAGEDGKAKYITSRLRDGRLYGQFVQHGAESGRMSSREPNLQNVPSRTDEGKRLREAFVADEGHKLIRADYSQIEPRIIASLSGDPTMIETYQNGGDVYQAVADRMSVTRQHGKTLVLAIAYGVGPAKISADIGCSINEARDLMDFFARKFPKIGQHKARTITRAKRFKYAETVWGRRRYLPRLTWSNPEERSQAERQAYNHTIQGTAADIMKAALVNIHAASNGLESVPATILMTVHDEVVLTAPKAWASDVAAMVKSEMESVKPKEIVVPLVAEVVIVDNWGQAK